MHKGGKDSMNSGVLAGYNIICLNYYSFLHVVQ